MRSARSGGVTYRSVLCGVQCATHRDKRGHHTQNSAVTDVGPAELEARIRGGGAVVLDIYAVWCIDVKSPQLSTFNV